MDRIVQKIAPGSKLLRQWMLTGGISAQVTALEIEQADGQRIKRVVRQPRETNYTRAADEFRLMQQVQAAGILVPTPYFLDESRTILPAPYFVMDYIEGQVEPTDLPHAIQQMALCLATIHQIKDVLFLPHHDEFYTKKLGTRPAQIDDSISEGPIRDVLEHAWPFPQRNPAVLVHGDFWPGNILWHNRSIAAVLDWEDALRGDPLEDVAITRQDLLWEYGMEAMQTFTTVYRSFNRIDFSNLPYWDLCAALRPAFRMAEWAQDPIREQRMREQHRQFVAQAFDQL
jgi:aminoglycoside phosphotransferase (APT) family kinase protein